MEIISLENISKDTFLLYITIAIGILFFFTSIVKIELGHVLALFVTIIVLVSLTFKNNKSIDNFNKELEFKLKSLFDKDVAPEYFYTDADIINLFFNIKQDMSEYNYDAYKNAVECANNVLKIKFDIERDLCKPPIVPDITKNFTPMLQNQDKDKQDFLNVNQYDFIDDKKCKSILLNAYENYQVAEEYVKKCMNYLHSLIIIIPSEPVTHRKHEKISERLHILLKRNLDVIKLRYENSLKNGISHSTKFIDDYDNAKAYNKHTEQFLKSNQADNNFNFY